MGKLNDLWRGDLQLGDAFWNWAVLGALLINVTTTILFLILISADHPWPALIVGYAFSIPYNIVALVVFGDQRRGTTGWPCMPIWPVGQA